MKVYVSAVVSIENLKTQFAPDMDGRKFEELIEIDPTADFQKNKGGKYCPWIFRQEKKGNLTQGDYVNLKDALGYFLQNYKKYPKSDIGQYKTVQEFLEDTETVGNRELTDKEKAKLLKKQAHHAGDSDKKFLVEDGDWEVWQPLTHAGSISLARTGGEKATWCTAYEGDDYYWKSYSRRGPLYIFINTKDPKEKYQLHFESNSWYDIEDVSKGMNKFYEFCAEHPDIGDFFKVESKGGVQYRAGSLIGYDDAATEIIIPDGMTNLPSMRFPTGVQRLVIPDSIHELNQGQFQSLSELVSIRLPNGITEIPQLAFSRCSALESIEIPDSVLAYGSSAFADCVKLKTIKHSSSVTHIYDNCFMNCKNLETSLPDSVTYIGTNVFNGIDMASVRIPAGVSKISKASFQNSDIPDIDLNNVTIIGANAFRGSSVENINLSKVIQIGSSSFRGCHSLKHIEFNPEGVAVGPYAFADNEFTDSVVIHPTTQLGLAVFDDCPNVTIKWNKEDEDYEFYNIKLLIFDETKCPKLLKANQGYVPIETTSGKKYEVE